MYSRIDPTGCEERYGLIRVRLSMYLEEGDVRYNDPSKFFITDWNSPEALAGFRGATVLDETGQKIPVDWEEFAAWEAALPRAWLPEREFHSHFIALEPTFKDEDIEKEIHHHLPNFYRAWVEEWDKVKGGMGHGWDVACRVRLKRYNKLEPELYSQRRLDCLSKVEILKANASSFASHSTAIGESFEATLIDVGPGATDRGSTFTHAEGTMIDMENSANGSGALTSMEVWCFADLADTKVGTFSGSPHTFTSRDWEVLGAVVAGAKRTFSGLDCDVVTGDFIGVWFSYGYIEADLSGGSDIEYKNGDQFGQGEQTYSTYSGKVISLYATGETAAPGVPIFMSTYRRRRT